MVGCSKGMQRFDIMTPGLGFEWQTEIQVLALFLIYHGKQSWEWDGEEIWPLDCSVLKKATQPCFPSPFNGKNWILVLILLKSWNWICSKTKGKQISNFHKLSGNRLIILIILIMTVIHLKSQSTETCSLRLEGVSCGWPLCNSLVSAVAWVWTVAAETVLFPSKAIITVPCSQKEEC